MVTSPSPGLSSLTTPIARVATSAARRGRWRDGPYVRALPPLVEFVAVVVAILLLWPSFEKLSTLGAGRDDRFLQRALVVTGLPSPSLPDLCAAYDRQAAPILRDTLCASPSRGAAASLQAAMPMALASRWELATRAFAQPLADAERRTVALRRQAEDGDGELRTQGDAAAAIEAEIEPFVARYRIGADATAGPAPLACAWRWGRAALAAQGGADSTRMHADVILLLGAALDGRGTTAALASEASLPTLPASAAMGCAGIVETLAATASLMADARRSVTNERKNDAVRALARSAGTQWAAAMMLGYGFVVWSRHARRATLVVAVALVSWGAAAWAARVPWPFVDAGGFVPARAGASLTSAPATFVLVLAAAGVLLALVAMARGAGRQPSAAPAQSMSSRVGYAGLVLATGIGALLLIDLSFNGHAGNRYLALYHQGHLWLAMLLLSVLTLLRRDLSRALAWALTVAGEAVRGTAGRVGTATTTGALLAASAAALLVFGLALAHLRQLTSELGRVWLIFGAAWFFFLRAGPLTERFARAGLAGFSLVRYAWPMVFVVGVLIGAMFATRDMGPLLISGYAAGAFVAATLAMWWHHRTGHAGTAFALAAICFMAWIGIVTAALFRFGSLDAVAASRLESVAAPFASINDQLALVSWFQRAAPSGGFGLGTTPWCGFAPAHSCSGVPAQIHSDYTFTAMIGVFGPVLAWAMAIGAALWLHRLIRHHGRITRGEPRLVSSEGRLANDGQALLSWICVAWVVLTSCQLAVTVAGNLAVLPLTGVTFPFVSFGMTSLLVNTALLALCLNVDLPQRPGHV